jgi:hypothetical protein
VEARGLVLLCHKRRGMVCGFCRAWQHGQSVEALGEGDAEAPSESTKKAGSAPTTNISRQLSGPSGFQLPSTSRTAAARKVPQPKPDCRKPQPLGRARSGQVSACRVTPVGRQVRKTLVPGASSLLPEFQAARAAPKFQKPAIPESCQPNATSRTRLRPSDAA